MYTKTLIKDNITFNIFSHFHIQGHNDICIQRHTLAYMYKKIIQKHIHRYSYKNIYNYIDVDYRYIQDTRIQRYIQNHWYKGRQNQEYKAKFVVY